MPWKNDFLTNPGRAQSLDVYPLFERGGSDFSWKTNPFSFQEGGLADMPSTDFLFAYWAGRKAGTITAAD